MGFSSKQLHSLHFRGCFRQVAKGDTAIATQRLEILQDFPLLALNQAVQSLAIQFQSTGDRRRRG